MASTDARPVPRKNTAFRVTFPIYDADGDLVSGMTTPDSEVDKDGAGFNDCTNEATEIGSSGIYYLDLTSTEMNADTVTVIVKSATSGMKTTVIVLYPEEDGDIRADATKISGDSTAADNLELAFDGTGYAGGTTKQQVEVAALSTAAKAEVEAECQDALQGEKLDQLMNQPVSGGWAGVTADSALSLMAGGTFSASTDSLENIRDALTTIDDFLDTEVAAILAAVDTEVAAIKAKTDNLPAAPAATGDIPTAADNADAVWNEESTGHTDAGKAGEMLWTKIAAIVAKLPTNYIMGSSDQDNHDTDIDAILVDTAALADTNLTEPSSGAPSASLTVRQALAYLYFAFRNKRTQTTDTQTFFNDAGSAIFKRTHSDDSTTHTAEELAAP